jgi:sugar phosphate isomerase/epimerase
MKIATTTGDFSRFLPNDVEIVRALHRAGFRYIDLDMYFFTPSSPYMSDDWKSAVQLLKDEADRLQIKFVQAHSQGGNAFRDDADHVDFLIRSTQRSIEICHELGISNTVVHPGCADGVSKEEWFERNREFYKKLFPAMEKFAVNVLIENSTSANMGDRYFANSGADMLEFLKFVWDFRKKKRAGILALLEGANAEIHIFRSRKEAKRYLDGMEKV